MVITEDHTSKLLKRVIKLCQPGIQLRNKKLGYSSFAKMKENNRVEFLSYDELERQYRQAIELQNIHTLIV